MDLNNVSIEQLKRLLSVFKLSTTGTKRQLILRLNNISKEIRGQFEEMARQKGDKDGENSTGEDSGDENFEDDGGIQSCDKEDGETNGEDGEGNDEVVGSILRIRGKRNENYTEDDMHNQAGENSRNTKSSEREVKNGNVAVVDNFNENIEVSLSMATQVLSEFAGESCACKWTTQMHNIAKIYGIGGKFEKMLMVSKIKGKAYEWLHANSDRVLLPLDGLTAELISTFGGKSSKLEIRRKFEGRN